MVSIAPNQMMDSIIEDDKKSHLNDNISRNPLNVKTLDDDRSFAVYPTSSGSPVGIKKLKRPMTGITNYSNETSASPDSRVAVVKNSQGRSLQLVIKEKKEVED